MRIIKATTGQEIIVDNEDYDILNRNKISVNGNGYAVIATLKDIQIHRLIYGAADGKVIDHENGNKLDNRKENLRQCTQKENTWNRRKTKNKTSSKYKGVCLDKVYKEPTWIAAFVINKERLFRGYFTSEIAAANAYNYYSRQHHGEYAVLNDVPYMSKEEWESYQKKTERDWTTEKKTSKYRGVRGHKDRSTYSVVFRYKNKKYEFYGYKTEIEAALAYNQKVVEICGEGVKKLNIIDENEQIPM